MKRTDEKQFLPLDEEEKELVRSIAKDEWRETRDVGKHKKLAKDYAEATIRKDKRMNIRISERDLKNLKKRALEDGIPYQTMVSMILHKYLSGRYSEQSS
jgi:predicted DNA binding CopG/RHH family protein